MTAPVDIAALRKQLAEATPLPWRPEREPDAHCDWFDAVEALPVESTPIESTGTVFALGVAVGAVARREDAELIAAAVTALPALLDELEAHRTLARAAREALCQMRRSSLHDNRQVAYDIVVAASLSLARALDAPGVRPLLRAGDVVLHHPTGETWTLAYAENDRGDVSACGWPESIARAADCTLVTAATDEEHVAMLREWADAKHTRDNGGTDYRHVVCKRQLALEAK